MDRRDFLKLVSGSVIALGSPGAALAGEAPAGPAPDVGGMFGVLNDLTLCTGCRKCEWACNGTNHLTTQPLKAFEDPAVFGTLRRPDSRQFTVVNRFAGTAGDDRPTHVKTQCFHCNTPACLSACIVSAYTKEPTGAVTYDAWRCMGCRYCLVACPFQIPAYEYEDALAPRVRKCNLCHERIAREGGVPACVEICPTQSLIFGRRRDLLALAHARAGKRPDLYLPRIYGEHEAGGTAWLFLSGRPFEELGFPDLPPTPPSAVTESLQHGIFKKFIPQAGLLGILGMIFHFTRTPEASAAAAVAERPRPEPAPAPPRTPAAEPVGQRFFTPGTWLLCLVTLVGMAFALKRFLFGIGSVSNLTNLHPWGIWIGIDCATGVALAAGGFTTAALTHIFHRHTYESVVRPALLTALLGYTFAVIGLTVDLGRYYNFWHPLVPFMWSGNSVLFEIGICVTSYLTVLYIEFLPIVIERFRGRVALKYSLAEWNRPIERLLAFADRTLGRVMTLFILAGVLLSCLHQSSLGALMLIAPSKMSPLWYTPLLPLFFLMSAISVGYPMVIFMSLVTSHAFGRKPDLAVLGSISRYVPVFLGLYLTAKLADLFIRGAEGLAVDGSPSALLFLAELGLGVVLPMLLLLRADVRASAGGLFVSSLAVMTGIALNRVNVFLTAYAPPYAVRPYFPSPGEIAITAGLLSAFLLAFRLIVLNLPVLSKPHPAAGRDAAC